MNDAPVILHTAKIQSRWLEVVFERRVDRFETRIHLVDGPTTSPLLQSVEDVGPWPPSPPWQEVHVHSQSGGGHVLMLVGRAGKSHWSMSVTAESDRPALVFDVACRIRERPTFLGSRYQAASPLTHASQLPSGESDDARVQILEIRPPNVVSATARLEADAALQTVLRAEDADYVVILPELLAKNLPATIRWKYRIALREDP